MAWEGEESHLSQTREKTKLCLGCINKEDLRVLRLHVNVLLSLESHGGSVYEKKGPSQGKVHLCLRHESLLSVPESVTAGYKSSDFQISVELSLVLVKGRMLLKSKRD